MLCQALGHFGAYRLVLHDLKGVFKVVGEMGRSGKYVFLIDGDSPSGRNSKVSGGKLPDFHREHTWGPKVKNTL